eukprot:gene25459-30112_t
MHKQRQRGKPMLVQSGPESQEQHADDVIVTLARPELESWLRWGLCIDPASMVLDACAKGT